MTSACMSTLIEKVYICIVFLESALLVSECIASLGVHLRSEISRDMYQDSMWISKKEIRITQTRTAKLAVFMLIPKKFIIHCLLSAPGDEASPASYSRVLLRTFAGMVVLELALQGTVPSERRTPRSRASCSKVIGIKDPTPQTTKTSAAQPYEYLYFRVLALPSLDTYMSK